MTCRDWQRLLHEHLDGGPPADLEAHLDACLDCAAWRPAVRRLLAGVALLAPPPPPPGLAGRVGARLAAEARVRRRWRRLRLAPLALAAAALLLVLGRLIGPAPPAERPRPVAEAAEPAAEPLRDSMAEAGTAVAALTTRTASVTIDQTATLLPLVHGAALESLPVDPPPMEPPMEPLLEAGAGVTAGLAPVADGARRAVGLFLRDLPLSRADAVPPDKPG